MILEALSPSADSEGPAAPPTKRHGRRRGLSLSDGDEAPEAVPAQAGPAQAAPVDTAPVRQVAARPLTAAAPAQPKLRALDLDIQFQFNSDQLTNDGKDVLDQLATALKSDKLSAAQQVILEGHADAKGAASYNQTLSLKRAQSARNYLASRHDISEAKLKAVGKGSSELADPAHPESEINRRVRVIVGL